MANGQLDLSQAEPVAPDIAPAVESGPLTGKEKAGVNLTWGVLVIIGLFLILTIMFLWWGESNFQNSLEALSKLDVKTLSEGKVEKINTLVSSARESQESFREFWMDMVQRILLNVLFPVLTALLGYVFGTQATRSDANKD